MDVLSGILICVILFFTTFYAYFKYSFGYFQARGIPCAVPTIPFGHIKGLGKKCHMIEIIKKIYDEFKPTGAKVCGIYFFVRPVIVLLDLDVIKNVFVKDFSNFTERNMYYNEDDDPLSANLLTLDGEKWKKLRAKLTPTFTSGKMKFMFPTIVMVAERFRDHLHAVTRQTGAECVLEIKELCARFTTDVIGTCAFGIECNSLNDPNAEFRHYGRDVIAKPRHGVLFVALLGGFKNIARKLHIKGLRDDVAAFFTNVVRDSIDYRNKNNVSRNDFMELLIKLLNNADPENSITFNELAAQAFIFFMAGFETSSSTLTFCLYELSLNPDIQAKARRIIQDAYKKYNGEFTYEMMMDLPYIDQILEETLRKYPPGSFLSRRTTNDYPINGTDVILEGGRTVLIPVHAIHYDPEYYPNPQKFDPDRFSSNEKMKRNATTWLAFGDGPRNCIGLRFGMMQARIGLVALLKDFEFSISSKTKIPIDISKQMLLTTPEECYLNVKSIE